MQVCLSCRGSCSTILGRECVGDIPETASSSPPSPPSVEGVKHKKSIFFRGLCLPPSGSLCRYTLFLCLSVYLLLFMFSCLSSVITYLNASIALEDDVILEAFVVFLLDELRDGRVERVWVIVDVIPPRCSDIGASRQQRGE